MKKLRDNLYIGETAWCIIQSIVCLIGVYLFQKLGIALALKLCDAGVYAIDLPFISMMFWLILFTFLKFWIEDKFSDYIDT